MILKKSKTNKITAAVLAACIILIADSPVSSAWSIQLGTFKTLTGLRHMYNSLPDAIKKEILICRSGDYYVARYGFVANKAETKQLISTAKSNGLTPMVVECNTDLCSTPEAIFKESAKASHRITHPEIIQSISIPAKAPKKQKQTYNPDQFFGHADIMVLPEITTKVILSSTDINRITCDDGPIKDVVYSKEKGLSVKINNSNAFVKFLAVKKRNELRYPEKPVELYFICGPDAAVYTVIAVPEKVPAQNIRLVSKKKRLKKNLSLFEGIPFEKKVLMLTKYAFQENIPESFTVRKADKKKYLSRDLNISLRRTIIAEGEGIQLKEYLVSIKQGSSRQKMTLEEKYFLLPELTENPIGITLEKTSLTKGETGRLFVVEKHSE